MNSSMEKIVNAARIMVAKPTAIRVARFVTLDTKYRARVPLTIAANT